MITLKKTVYNAVLTLHRKTGKEWLHLSEIYEEVSKTAKEYKNKNI